MTEFDKKKVRKSQEKVLLKARLSVEQYLKMGLEIHAKYMNAKSQDDRNNILEIIQKMEYVKNQN